MLITCTGLYYIYGYRFVVYKLIVRAFDKLIAHSYFFASNVSSVEANVHYNSRCFLLHALKRDI